MLKLIVVLCVALLSSEAFAQGYMELRVTLFPAGSFVAKSSKVSGGAQKSGQEVSASNIKVDTASFDSGIELRNKHMRQRFEADKFPHAILVEARGKDGVGKAKLTVKGVTKEVSGEYKLVDDKTLEATFKTKASEFNIKDVSYMGVGMEDDLEVFVRVPVGAGEAKAATTAPTKSKAKPTPTKKTKRKK